MFRIKIAVNCIEKNYIIIQYKLLFTALIVYYRTLHRVSVGYYYYVIGVSLMTWNDSVR